MGLFSDEKPPLKTPIWGTEGYVDCEGRICHKTVIVGYEIPRKVVKEEKP